MAQLGQSRGLHAAGLVYRWRHVTILSGADLVLEPGSITALSGANGAGKTTLLRLLAGALQPLAGRVTIDGVDLTAQRRHYLRRVALLGAGDRGLYARLDVRANVDFAAALAAVEPAGRRDVIDRALARLDLGELADRRVDRLSLGQRQRVRFACAVAPMAPVLLLDEPMNSLDAAAEALVVRVVDELAAAGVAVLWTAPAGRDTALRADLHLRLRGPMLEQVD